LKKYNTNEKNEVPKSIKVIPIVIRETTTSLYGSRKNKIKSPVIKLTKNINNNVSRSIFFFISR
jgi:hypothetical protein